MSNDPRVTLAQSPMSRFQIIAVGICIFLNALDGFDVLAISFASPGIASDWEISRVALGVVLSMELIGMALGSVLLGNFADKFGRRPTIIFCLTIMSVGMLLASMVGSVNQLLVVRFVTGIGIGGMLAATNAMVAEYSNQKSKNLCVMLMAAGYPVGAILGGMVSTQLLELFDWRSIFVFGALATASAFILVWFFLPESIEHLANKQPADALARINKTLKRMGREPITSLPAAGQKQKSGGIVQLFSPGLLPVTLILTLAYFFHILAFYYILKWIPKIVVDMEYAASEAGSVLVWANIGGAIGSIVVGVIATKIDLRKVMIGVMVVSFLMITYFGTGHDSLATLAVVSACTGFFTNAGVVGLYAMFARYFPASVRASGTGFAIGVGRGGAVLGPIFAGFLFDQGMGLLKVSMVMGASALAAAVVLLFLKKPVDSSVASD
jgi:benzoate transport